MERVNTSVLNLDDYNVYKDLRDIINSGNNFIIIDFTNTFINNNGIVSPFKGYISKKELEDVIEYDLEKSFTIDDKNILYERSYKVGNIMRKRRKRI